MNVHSDCNRLGRDGRCFIPSSLCAGRLICIVPRMVRDVSGEWVSKNHMLNFIGFLSPLGIIQFASALFFSFAVVVPSHGQPAREPSPEVASLQSYAGQYQVSPDTVITVRPHGNGLTLEW
jgi:hypothetical protein